MSFVLSPVSDKNFNKKKQRGSKGLLQSSGDVLPVWLEYDLIIALLSRIITII